MSDDAPDVDYSIGATAEATGISTETLRVWERRYGKPVPVRRPSGHRRYTAEQVRWLRRIAEALARGNRPGLVVRMSEDELDELLGDEAAASEPVRPDIDEMTDAVKGYDGARFVELLDKAWEPRGPIQFMDEIAAPVAEEIGRRWADGELEVRHEHYASDILDDFLRSRYSQFVPAFGRPVVVLATLSGERHSLGIRMASLVCASEGVRHFVLGADSPNREIAATAREARADVVGISVSLATGGVETSRVLKDLRESLGPNVRLVVGGKGACSVGRGPRGVETIQRLSDWALWLRQSAHQLAG